MSHDIHFEGAPTAEVRGTQCLTFGRYSANENQNWRTLGVQGIQKMVNRFLKCIMTPAGTDISDPAYGTQFATLFIGNVDSLTVRQVVNESVRVAAETIQQYDVDNATPSDERLASASIESLNIADNATELALTVLLKNVAGTVVRLTVPDMFRSNNG